MAEKKKYKNTEVKEEIIKCQIDKELSSEAVKMFKFIANGCSTEFNIRADENPESSLIKYGIQEAKKYWKYYNPNSEPDCIGYFRAIIKGGMLSAFTKLEA